VGAGCTLHELARHGDERGLLAVAEVGAALPFTAERFFVVRDVPAGGRRGVHANREAHELLVAMTGRVEVELDDGFEQVTVTLDGAGTALHIPPLVWSTQVYGPGACLLVLASTPFHPDDHIVDHDEFRRTVGARPVGAFGQPRRS
jgi:hypothetical protein